MFPKFINPYNIVIAFAAVLIIGYFLTMHKKSSLDYQKVTLQEIETSPDKYDGEKVEYSGIWTTAFEVSNLDGKIWLEASNKIIEPILSKLPDRGGQRSGKVKVFGTLQTKLRHYGHLGMTPYQIIVDRIELVEKIDLANSNTKTLETREFSCPGMTGFTFKYPVFRGWEVLNLETSKTRKNECIIFLNHPDGIKFETAPQIIVLKQAHDPKIDFELPADAISNPPNPSNIPYIYTDDPRSGNFTTFYIPGFKVSIKLGSYSDEHGFSKDLFWKTIIESFKITNMEITKEKAIEIVRSDLHLNFKPINFDPNDYNIEAKLGSDGWHIDYSLKNPPPNLIGGGAPHYIIDGGTGNIIKKWFDR